MVQIQITTLVIVGLVFIANFPLFIDSAAVITPMRQRPVTIVGGGPVGLATALTLNQRGFQDITVIEKRPQSLTFEQEKSYLYLIDARGQLLTDSLNITSQLASKGVPSSVFTSLTEVLVDGSTNIKKIPALMTPKQEKYWIPRSELLTILENQCRAANPGIKFLFDTTIERIAYNKEADRITLTCVQRVSPDAATTARTVSFETTVLLGCDGFRSQVREFLATNEDGCVDGDAVGFVPTSYHSDSAGLQYKMLSPKASFPLPLTKVPSQSITSYAIRGTGTTPTTRLSLGLLPVKVCRSVVCRAVSLYM